MSCFPFNRIIQDTIMLPLVLLFASALASGPPITIENPEVCVDENGYLPGIDNGLDCCAFVVCDAARLNKTGFQGACMGGTVWNNDLKVCDDPKYVPDCDPTTCVVPKRTGAPCADAQPSGTTCCVGQNPDQGINGYEPVFTAGPSEGGYYVGSDVDIELESFCPFGQIFVLEDCCCEYEFVEDAICAEDPESFFFANPDDPCCSFLQCWANRTGYDTLNCMGGSVYNAENQTCDTIYNVMDCMEAVCDNDFTDPPCDDSGLGDCCRAGTWFNAVADDPIQYEIVAGQGKGESSPSGVNRLSCCPVNMAGEQMEFNATPGICCCEVPAEAL
ncbi:unnamed protein product [Owenia fusiformis]|uniref:Chitin-binding type-2 domain-containing protein n=2 Tax=Owenia fusiformis TaxID=6347 RepID=A0A8S4NI92_OWEFU|nr:unnamed protein product [Owenia fusiformis]